MSRHSETETAYPLIPVYIKGQAVSVNRQGSVHRHIIHKGKNKKPKTKVKLDNPNRIQEAQALVSQFAYFLNTVPNESDELNKSGDLDQGACWVTYSVGSGSVGNSRTGGAEGAGLTQNVFIFCIYNYSLVLY